jgi:hypothetical protein
MPGTLKGEVLVFLERKGFALVKNPQGGRNILCHVRGWKDCVDGELCDWQAGKKKRPPAQGDIAVIVLSQNAQRQGQCRAMKWGVLAETAA